MKINRENCEAWFLDYYEGNLSKEEEKELFAFLVLHPDLREQFDSYEEVSFDADKGLHFDAKDDLKKKSLLPEEITKANCEDFFIADAEGLLSGKEKKLLEKFLAENPARKNELELFRKTKLKPESEIVFENKNSLKKAIIVTEENFAEYAVAALDGELDKTALEIFNAFVAAHPSKKEELDLLAKTKLPQEKIVFENKAALKKSAFAVTDENFEELCSAHVDGTLSAEQKNAVGAFIASHPEKQNIVALYNQTKLSPDASIVFEDKASLKRKEKDRGLFWIFTDLRFAAAAVVVLLIGILWWTNRGGSEKISPGSQIANDNHSQQHDSVSPAQKLPALPPGNSNQLANTNNSIRITPPKNFRNILTNKNRVALNNHSIRIIPPKNFKTQNSDQNIASSIRITPPKNFIVNDGSPVVAMNSRDVNALSVSPLAQQVDFSGSFYDDQDFSAAQENTSQDISFRQYVMRRAKRWLDHAPGNNDDDNAQVAYNTFTSQKQDNGNVSGFDLTSSAVNRIGEATGGNFHLGKDAVGTALSVGKYKIYLSKN